MSSTNPSPPLIIGHRGSPYRAPENTLASFRTALEKRVDGIEFDCQLSKDGHVVVVHDETVERTTDGWGRVRDLTLAELKSLDAGSWFDEQFVGERIPTLEEVLDFLAPSGVLLMVEIKSESYPSSLLGDPSLSAKVVASLKKRGLVERTILTSSNPMVLWQAKQMEPRLARGLSFQHNPTPLPNRGWFIPLVRPHALIPEHGMVNPEYVQRAKGKGFRLFAWTPNEPSKMRRLFGLGLDGIVTDRPDFLRHVISQTFGT